MGRRKSPNVHPEGSGPAESPQPLADDTDGGALAPAHPAAACPTGRQSLDRHGRALRRGLCPRHKTMSRRFVGVNAEGWVFSCAIGPHNFTVAPDPTAPKGAYEAAAATAWAKSNPHN